MKIVERNINELIPAEYNPRKLSAKQNEDITASITRFGIVDPILINMHPERKNIIVGGHMRTRVAKEMGFKTIPCVEINLSLDKEKELNIRLNKNTGSWDDEILADLFKEEELLDFGFEELDPALGNFHLEEEAVDDDYKVELPKKARSKPGVVYVLGKHRLMCGDATNADDMALLMDGQEADLYLTDPPYNIDYASKNKMLNKVFKGNKIQTPIKNDVISPTDFMKFLDDLFETFSSVLKQGGVFYIFYSEKEQFTSLYSLMQLKLVVRENLIWVKNKLVIGRQDYQHKHEPCFYGWKDGAAHFWNSDRKQTTILEFDKPFRNGEHPTMKPIPLIAYLMTNSTKKRELVLDSCGGSGTTLIAAEQSDRKCNIMELDPIYCDVIIDRYCKLTGIDKDSVYKTS